MWARARAGSYLCYSVMLTSYTSSHQLRSSSKHVLSTPPYHLNHLVQDPHLCQRFPADPHGLCFARCTNALCYASGQYRCAFLRAASHTKLIEKLFDVTWKCTTKKRGKVARSENCDENNYKLCDIHKLKNFDWKSGKTPTIRNWLRLCHAKILRRSESN